VSLFCERGAAVSLTRANGFSSLMAASQNGHAGCVRLLLDHRAIVDAPRLDDGWNALMLASQKGHADCCGLLLNRKADVMYAKANGHNSLMAACQFGQVDAARLLLDQGADPTVKRTDGETALTLATQKGSVDVARLLQAHGVTHSASPPASAGAESTGGGKAPTRFSKLRGTTVASKLRGGKAPTGVRNFADAATTPTDVTI